MRVSPRVAQIAIGLAAFAPFFPRLIGWLGNLDTTCNVAQQTPEECGSGVLVAWLMNPPQWFMTLWILACVAGILWLERKGAAQRFTQLTQDFERRIGRVESGAKTNLDALSAVQELNFTAQCDAKLDQVVQMLDAHYVRYMDQAQRDNGGRGIPFEDDYYRSANGISSVLSTAETLVKDCTGTDVSLREHPNFTRDPFKPTDDEHLLAFEDRIPLHRKITDQLAYAKMVVEQVRERTKQAPTHARERVMAQAKENVRAFLVRDDKA